ncbi:MAG TPA: hypothetical protein VMT58_08665 [Candidatus Binataceae bacterium]|nr:hypothetical protein [Candidatus Binataceae bacterium]
MKKLLAAGIGIAATIGLAATAMAGDKPITGTLEDSYCFAAMGAHGASHKECALKCAQAGIPVMLVEKNGKAYILLPAKNGESLPKSVIDKMEDEVTVTGKEYRKGGVSFLTVDSIK